MKKIGKYCYKRVKCPKKRKRSTKAKKYGAGILSTIKFIPAGF